MRRSPSRTLPSVDEPSIGKIVGRYAELNIADAEVLCTALELGAVGSNTKL